MYCARYALRALEFALAQGAASEATLADLQRLVEDEERLPSILVAARGERAALDALMERLQTGEVGVVQVRNGLPGVRPKPPGLYGAEKAENLAWSLSGASLKANRGMLLEYMNELVEVARLPVEKQQDYLDRLERRKKELPLLAREMGQDYVSETFKAYQQSRAELRCTAALIAAERFRLARGRLPESLKELVPGFLDKRPSIPMIVRPCATAG